MLRTQFLSTVDELYNIATKLNVCFVFTVYVCYICILDFVSCMQIENAKSNSELQEVCSSGMDLILDAGYSKAIASISLDSKQELTNTLVLHYTLYRNKAVLDQLRSGLQVLFTILYQ